MIGPVAVTPLKLPADAGGSRINLTVKTMPHAESQGPPAPKQEVKEKPPSTFPASWGRGVGADVSAPPEVAGTILSPFGDGSRAA